VVLAAVALGEMPNPNLLFFIKFCGSNHLIRSGLVRVIPKIYEINLVHDLKSRQIVQFLFIVILGYLNSLNKSGHCLQSCRGLQYLSRETKITLS
jgi:hypothetical protein